MEVDITQDLKDTENALTRIIHDHYDSHTIYCRS
jgi:hypothetical protein